jgi:hypothetical protein
MVYDPSTAWFSFDGKKTRGFWSRLFLNQTSDWNMSEVKTLKIRILVRCWAMYIDSYRYIYIYIIYIYIIYIYIIYILYIYTQQNPWYTNLSKRLISPSGDPFWDHQVSWGFLASLDSSAQWSKCPAPSLHRQKIQLAAASRKLGVYLSICLSIYLSTLQYITVHYSTLHYIALHYITLHTNIYILCIYMYIQLYVYHCLSKFGHCFFLAIYYQSPVGEMFSHLFSGSDCTCCMLLICKLCWVCPQFCCWLFWFD